MQSPEALQTIVDEGNAGESSLVGEQDAIPVAKTGKAKAEKVCGECQQSKAKSEFSKKQWKKNDGSLRCKSCVDGKASRPAPAPAPDKNQEEAGKVDERQSPGEVLTPAAETRTNSGILIEPPLLSTPEAAVGLPTSVLPAASPPKPTRPWHLTPSSPPKPPTQWKTGEWGEWTEDPRRVVIKTPRYCTPRRRPLTPGPIYWPRELRQPDLTATTPQRSASMQQNRAPSYTPFRSR